MIFKSKKTAKAVADKLLGNIAPEQRFSIMRDYKIIPLLLLGLLVGYLWAITHKNEMRSWTRFIHYFRKKTAKEVADKLMGIDTPKPEEKRPWYKSAPFPLIPWIWTKKADEHNTFGWQFEWLLFRCWSLDSFQFEIAFQFDLNHWGIGFTGQLPYVRWTICIPPYHKIGSFVQKHLWRHSKQIKNLYDNPDSSS